MAMAYRPTGLSRVPEQKEKTLFLSSAPLVALILYYPDLGLDQDYPY
jgi:hypothetical protein